MFTVHRRLPVPIAAAVCLLFAAAPLRAADLNPPIEKGLRVMSAGHSFHVFMPGLLNQIVQAAKIEGHKQLGVQSIGGSRVIQHWDLAEDKQKVKPILESGEADVLTLSPIYLPDEGIRNYVKLAAEKSPNTRVLIQEFWLPYDVYQVNYQRERPKQVDRNARTAEELRHEFGQYFKVMDAHVEELNKEIGKQMVFVTPVGQAVVALREKIIKGEAPGLKQQNDLFTDAIGHATAPLQALCAYCHYAVIYRRSPVGLPTPANLAKYGDELNKLLQELAWNAAAEHPLSGVTVATATTAPAANQGDAAVKTDKLRLYVGTYTGPKSKGIYTLELNLADGSLSAPKLAAEVESPSFLAIHPSRKFLYAVNEVGKFAGENNNSGVSALAIDGKTGDLKLLNQQSSRGAATCHLCVDKEGKNVLVASYTGGSVAVLPIKADGSLAEISCFVPHNPDNKPGKSHAHSINLDAANRYAVAADLGLQKLFVYKFDPAAGTVTPNEPSGMDLPAGSGPRHFAFHPNGKNAYVINEQGMTVAALDYDAQAGTLKEIQTVSTIPGEKQKGYSTAEVVVHPSGKFVYGSNRGQNSIAVFKVDQSTGKLTPGGHQSSGVKTPRNFAVDPTGKYLIVANQDGHNLSVFTIDQQSGELSPTGHTAEIGSPVCVRMIPLE